MEIPSIAERVRAFVIDNYLFGQDNDLKNTDSFLDNGIIDSTGVLELVSYIEETFNVTVADEDLIPDNLDSIDQVTRYIGRKAGVQAEVFAGELRW